MLISGWVNQLVGGQKAGAKGFMFFIVNVDLSEDGIGRCSAFACVLRTPVTTIGLTRVVGI